MIDIIGGIIVVVLFSLAALAIIGMCLQDTEAFRAIDEKIASMIKGEEEE